MGHPSATIAVLERLANLFALSSLENQLSYLLEYRYVLPSQARVLFPHFFLLLYRIIGYRHEFVLLIVAIGRHH